MDTNRTMKRFGNKNRIIIFLLLLIIIIVYVDYHKYNWEPTAVNILKYHANRVEKLCSNFPTKEIDHKYKDLDLKKDFPMPECENILHNITEGKWVKNEQNNFKQVKQINIDHLNYRKHQGIVTEQWREDGQCGYSVLSKRVTNSWPQSGSFCDPLSKKPCCTDYEKGVCAPISKANDNCNCKKCVNTKNYHDALLSTWHTNDQRCKWNNYNQHEACSILNNLAKNQQPAEILFLGDSLIRNTFMGLESVLINKNQNILRKCVTDELKDICINENIFLRRECHDFAAAHSLDNLKHDVCDGLRNFDASFLWAMGPEQLFNLLEKRKGKENTYVVLGIGLHFKCDADKIINNFLRPALTQLNHNKNSWPRIIWTPPLSIGLLKPPIYFSIQGDKAITIYTQKLEEYFRPYGIPMFDFRGITKGVNSYDGTHYGTGVNVMKAQIILNYFATIL